MPHAGGLSNRRVPIWLWLVGAGFVLTWVVIVGASIRRPDAPVFVVSPPADRDHPTAFAGPDTVTVDARAENRWVRFDLARRRMATAGDPWDIAVRRHRLIINGGAGFAGRAAVLYTDQPFGAIAEAPAEGYTDSRVTPNGDSTNSALDDWYAYGFFSHLLAPEPITFILRTADGHYAELRILGYYCPGPEAGCMTFEYVYQGDGSRTLTSATWPSTPTSPPASEAP